MIKVTDSVMVCVLVVSCMVVCRDYRFTDHDMIRYPVLRLSVIAKQVGGVRDGIASTAVAAGQAVQEAGLSIARFLADEVDKSCRSSGLFGFLGTAFIFAGIIFSGFSADRNRKDLSRLGRELTRLRNAPAPTPHDRPSPSIDHSLACALCRELFRMRGRINGAGVPGESLGRAMRRLEDELGSRGYSIHDLTGLAYHTGMRITVSNVIVVPGIGPGEEKIVRTIRPEIVYKGSILEPGTVEVSVGREADNHPIDREALHVSQDH